MFKVPLLVSPGLTRGSAHIGKEGGEWCRMESVPLFLLALFLFSRWNLGFLVCKQSGLW